MALFAVVACGASGGGPTSGEDEAPEEERPADAAPAFGVEFVDALADGSRNETACVQQTATAVAKPGAVDLVFVIDNSTSMLGEIAEVVRQLNRQLYPVLVAAGTDFNVQILTGYGERRRVRVCVSEPLGGGADADEDGFCDQVGTEPTQTPRLFHKDVLIGSNNGLCLLLSQLATGGLADRLRPNAIKNIAIVTDDNPNCSLPATTPGGAVALDERLAPRSLARRFETALQSIAPNLFGASEETRNYVFWSFVGQESSAGGLAGGGEPIGPMTPASGRRCEGAVAAGQAYQELSIVTGGYRYPTCGAEPNYESMFRRMAESLNEQAKLPCQFQIPTPPNGETLDRTSVVLEFEEAGVTRTFLPVAGLNECAGRDGIYLEGDSVRLCPQSCQSVEASKDGKLQTKWGCELVVK